MKLFGNPDESMNAGIENLDYEVVRSQRASKARIDMDLHGMRVVIPEGMNLDPETLVRKKREWIRKKQAKFEELRSRIPDRTFEEGETFPYKGELYPLAVEEVDDHRVGENSFILASAGVKKQGVKNELEKLYRRKAREFIFDVIEVYSDKLDVEYGDVKIKNQKTLWGSCSSRSNLNFNWRLIMAPPDVGRYIVLHELTHLREPNHSSSFWNLLSRYCESPREKARWLREHSVELIFTQDDL